MLMAVMFLKFKPLTKHADSKWTGLILQTFVDNTILCRLK